MDHLDAFKMRSRLKVAARSVRESLAGRAGGSAMPARAQTGVRHAYLRLPRLCGGRVRASPGHRPRVGATQSRANGSHARYDCAITRGSAARHEQPETERSAGSGSDQLTVAPNGRKHRSAKGRKGPKNGSNAEIPGRGSRLS